ncbi:uncharacterized protein LOC18446480 isoform X2 [Amborella trichopoda]|uniref:uncharacterized protein LOC18446480 isoform X2 n=1 Tax=Amborella trichopoda TaxID=13333 RepID=UPI0009BD0F06|nr:uncharacterized protein LOC18446480 isoform X2 [Amborella trichopoda]|eukprot:XP_020530670.1 uncharacterized protein LOC18446480 isoform X2 [Amborella trichopoda]
MADDCWILNKMLLLIFAMICGVFICFVCLKQISTHVQPMYVVPNIIMVGTPCPDNSIEPADSLYLHYPQPTTYGRGECRCTPVRHFSILSMQRSGSGWFETLLNSHPNISSNGEIFSVKERRSNISSVLRTLDKVYNLEWTSSAAKNECTAAVGFKWMLNQGLMEYHKDIVDYFNRRGISAIFLFRRNLLHRLVSVLANAYDRDAKQLNGTHKSHVHSKQEKLMDVQEFLRVPRRDLQSHQVKIHTRPISEQVENWDDVYNTLKGTQYEIFLNQSDYASN